MKFNEKIEYQNIFCDNSYKNLKVLESKIKTSKIEDTKKCLKNIKEKYKDFQKNIGNDDVNTLFQNDDIKTFVQKVEATHNKWSTYTRNNFKMKSNMDVQELFKFLEKVENRRTQIQMQIQNDKMEMKMDMINCLTKRKLKTENNDK